MKVQIDEHTASITTRGLDELETYMNGRPLEAVRPISDGAYQLPRPGGEITGFVGSLLAMAMAMAKSVSSEG
ncbi:MAG: hypothetical protein J0H48_10895 [Nitrosospira multiformis]|nr:hypothetical protein [Nitrosospira multiformis]